MQWCASAISSSRNVRLIGIEATVTVIPRNSDTNIWLLHIGAKTPPLFRPAALSISMVSISGEGDRLQTTTKRNAHQAEAGDHHRPGRSLGNGRHRAAADGEVLTFGGSNIVERGGV
jgi:hypothetical protein